MAPKGLTTHDITILEKIKDPESAPSAPLLLDPTLPRDPYVTDPVEYEKVTALERAIIQGFRVLEDAQLLATHSAATSSLSPDNEDAATEAAEEREQKKPTTTITTSTEIDAAYDRNIQQLAGLVAAYPMYASAHNNYAQALRRKYGDSVLLEPSSSTSSSCHGTHLPNHTTETTDAVATTLLHSLHRAIFLLTPSSPKPKPTPFHTATTTTALSPQAVRTLAQAHTQRGGLYHVTAKLMRADPEARLRRTVAGAGEVRGGNSGTRTTTVADLEDLASRDFMLGARYGNEIARGLAVATNPTAKLCGSIVREAMRKEFAGGLMAVVE